MLNNLLLVDRDFQVGEVIADILEDRGVQTTWVPSVTHALAALQRAKLPDLVLTEYRPPERVGLMVASEAVMHGVPFCLLTRDKAIADLMRAHGLPVLCKPFDGYRLRDVIELALLRRNGLGIQLAQLRGLDEQLRGSRELEHAA